MRIKICENLKTVSFDHEFKVFLKNKNLNKSIIMPCV